MCVINADCIYTHTYNFSCVNMIYDAKDRKQEEPHENSGFLCLWI